jgi:peptidoglycan/LPS O-acetylase OafA/YrhL
LNVVSSAPAQVGFLQRATPRDCNSDQHAPQNSRRPSTHLSGLDGLRGIAILSVVVFHTLSIAPQTSFFDKIIVHLGSLGWMGVDLFFVLSGFLITGILIDQRLKPRYFRTFFARRVLRIVPAYAAFLFSSCSSHLW